MAQLTPKDILEISEPIEAIYQRTVDELLINIAHHFNISGWERTRYWEIKKLSEMGALTKESAEIIARNTKMVPEEIEKAFLQVSEKACMDIDPQLREAAEKGILQNPENTPSTSVMMRDSIRSYVDQSIDKLNMTNTTMLQSTREAYLRGIGMAVSEAQLSEAKAIVETQALEVVTGQETRVRAIRKAMNQLVNTGIVGFYDRNGRKWQADTYAAMVVRTTSHNAAIQAIKTRQQEFGGGDIFQVSSHPGARPLCFPYQGKFFSWSGDGTFTDGAGHTHEYSDISDSSYGEPAGLFGINCGHHPIPMIPGFSYPQDGPEQTKAENDKEYEESQKQRAYERKIREDKRDLEIAKATGDEEMVKAAKQKVAQDQANIRAYLDETGRPRRYDREQIAGTPLPQGYKGWQKQKDSDIPLVKPVQKQYNFVNAKSIREAEDYAKGLGLDVSYKGIELEIANDMNASITAGLNYCPGIKETMQVIGSGQESNKLFKEELTKYYLDLYEKQHGMAGPAAQKMAERWASKSIGRISGNTLAFARKVDDPRFANFSGILINSKYAKDAEFMKSELVRNVKNGYHPIGCDTVKSVIDHEVGHQIDYAVELHNNKKMVSLYKSLTEKQIEDGLSRYATKNINEFIAEGYAEYLNNPTPRDIATKIGKIIEEAVRV